jgi:hypothetical protein
MNIIPRSCLFFFLFTAIAISLSCKKSTSEPEPISIAVNPDRITLLFRIGEEFDEMSFRFQHEGKNYVTRLRYAVSDANVETNVSNTQLVPPNAVLSIGSQTQIAFQGATGGLYAKYINNAPAFSTPVQNMLNSFNDNNASTGGDQPMPMDG